MEEFQMSLDIVNRLTKGKLKFLKRLKKTN